MPNTDTVTSPFLFSNFRPVEELSVANTLSIEGFLPQEVDGLYLRLGPNPCFAPVPPYHWFDGDGMIHIIDLSAPNSASYRNQYIQTAALEADNVAEQAVNLGLRHPPDITLTLQGGMPYRNTANTSVLYHHGRAFALCEFGEPYEISLPDAETIGRVTLGAPSGMTFNAHPKIDPVTGELLYLRHRLGVAPYLSFGTLDRNGVLQYEVDIDVSFPCMMHDFAFTPSYIVIMEHSLYFDLERAKAGKSAWVCNQDSPSRFGIFPRRASATAIRWLEASSCCVTHFVNAFENDNEILISGIRYQKQPEILTFSATEEDASRPMAAVQTGLYEWRINLNDGFVQERTLLDDAFEFPTLNPERYGQPFRYTYLSKEGMNSALAKFDHHTGSLRFYSYGRGRYGGEATFVARNGATKEDDGYLLVIVWDSRSGLSEMLVLDASSFPSEPIARIFLPVRVPFGFHGSFIPRIKLKSGE